MEFLRRVRNVHQRHGASGTITVLARHLGGQLAGLSPQALAEQRRLRLSDRSFDLQHGTHTGGIIEVSRLDYASGDAVRYQPTGAEQFHEMMAAIADAVPGATFIDFGCGKGRALLLASQYPFAAIVGVELSARLVAAARDNLASYRGPAQRCRDIALHQGDAASFAVPRTPSVYYLYNPFGPAVLAPVLAGLARANPDLAASRLVYLNPEHAETVLAHGWYPIVSSADYHIYRHD